MRISDWSSDVCSSDLLERFIAARCLNVDKQDLNFDDPHTQSFWEDYCATDRCLHYLHRPGITIDELRSQILSAHFAHGIKVVLVDYWQLIKIIGTKQNRSEQQYDSAKMMANLASELDIAIVMKIGRASLWKKVCKYG